MAISSTDIVERLRKGGTDSWTELAVMLDEAADEIAHLRTNQGKLYVEIDTQAQEIERLRAALREVMRELDDNEEAAAYVVAREALGDD